MHHHKCFEGFGKGLLAGLVAGAAASWVMEQFQVAWGILAEGAQSQGGASRQKQAPKTDEQAPATLKTAEMISGQLFHHELTDSEKKMAGPVVHYAFGAMVGGLYGATAEAAPSVTRAMGLPFGAALWLAADEVAVPALGFSEPHARFPVSTHLYALASHLVYGCTTEAVRRAVCRVLP